MKINNLFWHDGNLIDINSAFNKKGNATTILVVALYKNNQSKKRNFYKVECQKSDKLIVSLDTKELKNNLTAGNIDNGYIIKNTLYIHLFGGIIKITAKKFNVSKMK